METVPMVRDSIEGIQYLFTEDGIDLLIAQPHWGFILEYAE